jgi:hypothetical protein
VSGGTTADETKKAVCKAFTAVVKSSELAIDPKSFFMMLATSYAILCRDRRMDLGPLWDAMAGDHPKEQLYGVFLMFRLRAMDLGLKVLLPKAVDALSEDELRQAMQPWTGMMVADEPTPSELIPALGTADFKPFVPEETRRKVVQIVSSSIRNSPIGARFDAAKLTFQIDSAFEALFDGMTFDFAQIFAELRQSQSLDDKDVYWAVARAKIELSAMGLGVIEPPVSLNSIEKQNIVEEIRRTEKQRGTASIDLAQRTGGSGDLADKPPADEPAKRLTKEEKLKEYGLDSVNEKVRRPYRSIALGLFLVAGGVALYLTRPDRELSHEQYQVALPVKSAQLISDTFNCVVDESRWYTYSVEDRAARLAKFQAILQSEGRIPNMQCRDSKGQLVITASGPTKIVGASRFMKGDAAGTLPVANSKKE